MSDIRRIIKNLEKIEEERDQLAMALARMIFANEDQLPAARKAAQNLILSNSALVSAALREKCGGDND
jgi:uncharacterized protein Yka (UPF0111/DUF47 family)